MKIETTNKQKLFITAFLQVFLVSANTRFISVLFWPGIAMAGFGISWLWAVNVKKVTISSRSERFIYSVGAMCGGLVGVLLTTIVKK